MHLHAHTCAQSPSPSHAFAHIHTSAQAAGSCAKRAKLRVFTPASEGAPAASHVLCSQPPLACLGPCAFGSLCSPACSGALDLGLSLTRSLAFSHSLSLTHSLSESHMETYARRAKRARSAPDTHHASRSLDYPLQRYQDVIGALFHTSNPGCSAPRRIDPPPGAMTVAAPSCAAHADTVARPM